MKSKLMLPVILALSMTAYSQQPSAGNTARQAAQISREMQMGLNIDNVKVSMSKKKVTANDIFQELNQRRYIYTMVDDNVKMLPMTRSVDFKNKPLPEVLVKLMELYPIICKRFGNAISVKLKPSLYLKVSCLVIDSTDKPLANATVTIKATNESYYSNGEGRIDIPYVSKGDTLLIASERMKVVQAIVNTNELIIKLRDKAETLASVIVYNDGIQKKRADETPGSYVAPDMDLYSNRSANSNIIGRLVIGMPPFPKNENDINGTLPGSVRGPNTFYGNQHAFMIVNDFPFTVSTNFVNPNDIDTITILKDAGAGAIWGTISANGVWNMSYKKGTTKGKVINFISSITIGEQPDLEYQRGMDAASRITFDTMGYQYPGAYTPARDLIYKVYNNRMDRAEASLLLEKWKTNNLIKDIANEFYQNPVARQYALNLQTGCRNFLFYASGGLDEKNLAEKGNTWNRKTALLNTTYQDKNLLVEGTASYANIEVQNNFVPLPTYLRYLTLRDEQGNPADIPYLYPTDVVKNAQQQGFLDWRYIPIDESNFTKNTTSQHYYSFSGKAAYSFSKQLKASVAYQQSIYMRKDRQLHKLESFYTRNLVNLYRQSDQLGNVSWPIPKGDIQDENDLTANMNYLRAQVDYSRKIKGFAITALAGLDKRSFDMEGKENRIYGKNLSTIPPRINYDSVYKQSMGGKDKIPFMDHPYDSADHFFGYYGSAYGTFRNRYTISVNIRTDWSNRFSSNLNQKGISLWSVGGAWKISEEAFFKIRKITNLTLRGTIGVNGNIDYSALPTNAIQSVPGTQVYTYAASTQQIGAEKMYIYNVGFDFQMLFLKGSVDLYTKRGNNLLQFSPRNPVTGTSIVKDNSGSLHGKGLDLSLQTNRVKIIPTLFCSAGFFLAYTNNKVTSDPGIKKTAAEMVDPAINSPVKGYAVNALFAYKYGELDEHGDPLGYVGDKKSNDYAAITSATDGSTIQYMGSATPTTAFNMMNSIHYKDFTLSCILSSKFGFWVRKPALNYYKMLQGTGGEAPGFENRWQTQGDEQFKKIPALRFPLDINALAFFEGSTANVVKGDYIRLQDIQFSYRFENTKKPKFPFKTLECFVTATNLGFIYRANKDRIDPDIAIGAYSYGRSLTFTLKLSY